MRTCLYSFTCFFCRLCSSAVLAAPADALMQVPERIATDTDDAARVPDGGCAPLHGVRPLGSAVAACQTCTPPPPLHSPSSPLSPLGTFTTSRCHTCESFAPSPHLRAVAPSAAVVYSVRRYHYIPLATAQAAQRSHAYAPRLQECDRQCDLLLLYHVRLAWPRVATAPSPGCPLRVVVTSNGW